MSAPAAKKRRTNPPKTKWLSLTAEQASGSNTVGLSARSEASEVYLDKLTLTVSQREELDRLYESDQVVRASYHASVETEQAVARGLLAGISLDIDSPEANKNRWHVRWSRSSGKKNQDTASRRVLYQWYVLEWNYHLGAIANGS